MKNPIDTYWNLRLEAVRKRLDDNNFEAFLVPDVEAAAALVRREILPSLRPGSLSWGGSLTFLATGLYESLRDSGNYEVIDTFDHKIPPEEKNERRRRALLVDLFFTGTNALTEDGVLVNLDMIGNRVAALNFGPKNVVVVIGRSKLVRDRDEAFKRVKQYAAPVNTMRLDKRTPCTKTGHCENCKSPDRICNIWTVTEKSFPKGRIKVILINRDLGF